MYTKSLLNSPNSNIKHEGMAQYIASLFYFNLKTKSVQTDIIIILKHYELFKAFLDY